MKWDERGSLVLPLKYTLGFQLVKIKSRGNIGIEGRIRTHQITRVVVFKFI
jgi:hypothetical protein